MKIWGGAATCVLAMAMGTAAWGQAAGANPPAGAAAQSTAGPDKNADEGLVIEPTELPGTYPHGTYEVHMHARGNYVPVLRWRVQSGALPPGIKLEDNGELHGEAERAGEFAFVLSAKDGDQPPQAVQRGYVIKVVDGITVAWKTPAHVTGNRIEGSVEVSNATADDVDLTYDVKAVSEYGRATEIGYQRFPLKRGTIAMALPFGETLPFGGYVIYVNVVGEVARRNAIYRQGLQTPGALQVLVGP